MQALDTAAGRLGLGGGVERPDLAICESNSRGLTFALAPRPDASQGV
jgi:hypothetical protein